MELDEIVDKYRGFKIQQRYGMLALIGLLPAINLWVGQGDVLQTRKETADSEYDSARKAFEDARQKAAELPALESKLAEIEGELVKAKKVLPDKIEIDTILGFIGGLEKELDVKLVKFTPGTEIVPSNGLDYREWPVEIVMNGTFSNTMRLMDRLVHMQNLTHLRNIQFNAAEEDDKKLEAGPGKEAPKESVRGARKVDSQAKLILFKGV